MIVIFLVRGGVFFSFDFGRKCVVVGSVMEELEKMRRDAMPMSPACDRLGNERDDG